MHWGNFDSNMQGRVKEAVEKIALREKTLDASSLQEELDMVSGVLWLRVDVID